MNHRSAQARRGLTALGVSAVLAFGAAGCGDDEETPEASGPPPASPVEETPPAGTEQAPAPVPEPEPEPEPEEPEPAGPAEPGDDSGGISPPEPAPEPEPGGGGSGGVGPAHDSPDNDVPPQPGTPEEQFEQHCNEHPEACG